MQQISLNGIWKLTYGPQANHSSLAEPLIPAEWSMITAEVPGNVELDLMAAGLLPDISVGNNIYLLRQLIYWHGSDQPLVRRRLKWVRMCIAHL